MSLVKSVLLFAFAGLSTNVFAQAPAAQTAPASQAPAAPQVVLPSAILQPSLTSLQSTLDSLKLDKWKKGTVRDEASDNVNAILRDLQNNVPPLIAAADATPSSLSKAIPLMKHLDALYDVVLRVEEASRVIAPADQVDTLQRAMLKLSTARITLDDQMTAQAATQEKQVVDLQAALKAQQVAAEQKAAAPKTDGVPCKPTTPTHRKHKPRTTAKPSPSTSAGQQKTQ